MTDETEIEAKLTIINRLLASFPASSSGSPDEVIDGFMIAVGDIPINCLAAAAARFLQGAVSDHNKKFAPSPAELSSEARVIWRRESIRQERDREARQQIEARPQILTEAELAQRRAYVADLLKTLPQVPDVRAERSARLREVNTRFLATDPRSIEERLKMNGTGK